MDILELLTTVLSISLAVWLAHSYQSSTTASIKRATEMARLISEKSYQKAISIGESHIKRSTIERMNLVAAYFNAGQKEKAKQLAKTLKTSVFQTPQLNSAISEWKTKLGASYTK